MVKRLLSHIPPHHIYVEVFGGGASLLFAKPPSPVEVYNDVDGGLVGFYRVLRDPEKFARFYQLVQLTPYSHEEYNDCRETWEDKEDEVERARKWYVVARQSFGGRFGSGWGFVVKESNRGMAQVVSQWLSAIDNLPQIHERISRVQIENRDYRDIIPCYDTIDTLFYCDPPYIHGTRKGQRYAHEMTDDDHQDLVEMLLEIKGMAMLSGYRHEIYQPLEEAGWARHDYETACHVAGRTRYTGIQGEGTARRMQPRTESIWLSPNCAVPVNLELFYGEVE